MKRSLLMPFQPSPLMLVALFTLLSWILELAGYLGAAVAVVPISWFFKYCFVMLDAVLAGDDEAPVLDLEMVNPLSEQRPLAQLLVIGAGYLIVRLATHLAGLTGLIASSAVLLPALPASVAVLALTGNPLRAASPAALTRLARELGKGYAVLVSMTLVVGWGLYALVRDAAPLGLIAALAQFGFLSLFVLIGAMVHENRHRLGIKTRTRAERRAEREQHEHDADRKRMLEQSFNALRLGRSADSWGLLQRWIAKHAHGGRTHAEYAALLDSTLSWEPHVVGDRLVCEYLTRLLALKENGRALEVLERRLATNPRFSPQQAQQCTRLRELAALAGKSALGRHLNSLEGPREPAK